MDRINSTLPQLQSEVRSHDSLRKSVWNGLYQCKAIHSRSSCLPSFHRITSFWLAPLFSSIQFQRLCWKLEKFLNSFQFQLLKRLIAPLILCVVLDVQFLARHYSKRSARSICRHQTFHIELIHSYYFIKPVCKLHTFLSRHAPRFSSSTSLIVLVSVW